MVHSPLTHRGEARVGRTWDLYLPHAAATGADVGGLGKMDSVTGRAGCFVRVNVDNEALDGAVGNEFRALHPVTKARPVSRLKGKFSRPRGGDLNQERENYAALGAEGVSNPGLEFAPGRGS